MVLGLIIFKWNVRIGVEIEAKIPKKLEIEPIILKQIYSAHFLEDRPGFISLMVETLNVASYYTGHEFEYFISLLLDAEEDPDDYEDVLIDTAQLIMVNLQYDKHLLLLPNILDRISLYPTFKEEQKLAYVYSDEVRHLIMSRLVEEGNTTKNDLSGWLKEKLEIDYLIIDDIINSLVKLGLIKTAIVKIMPSELLFLIKDILLVRRPPLQILEQIKNKKINESIASEYLLSVKAFFQNYKPTLDDEKIISDIITDMDSYIILNRFRLSPLTRQGLENLKDKVKNLEKALNKIQSAGLIQVLKDKSGEEYYFLKNDIYIEKIFPEYLIDTIRVSFNNKSVANLVLLEHLKNLRNESQLESKIIEKIDETIKNIEEGTGEFIVQAMKTKERIFFEKFSNDWEEMNLKPPI
ncbi:MAG: hypothetical protein HWN67_07020 [Candidatus Helarchaeota archaeon]|nr:hypothetical protein [Candidatus Helarchaeota archaeon]